MASEHPVRVVNLPDPTSTIAHPHGNHTPAIPDDIIRELSTYLDFNDQLALSLTSHHIHEVVRPRLREVVVEARQLAALHKWIFEDPNVRGPQLRALDFAAPPLFWSWFDNVRYFESFQYCFDIMGLAPNLEELSCASSLSHALGSQHLQAFTSLRCLRLCECTGKMLASLRLPATLTLLHLSDTPAGTVVSFRRIARSICHLPALTTLILERLSLRDDDEDDDDNDGAAHEDEDGGGASGESEAEDECDNSGLAAPGDADEGDVGEERRSTTGADTSEPESTDPPIVMSVRTLKTLEQVLPPCVSLESTFPRLRTLVLDGSTHLNGEVRPSGTLQHLVVSGSFGGEPVCWTVNHLTYVPGAPHSNHGLVLDSACDPTQLVSLTLQLVFASGLVWDQVTSNASNIRLLEIESLQTALPEYIALLHEQFKPGMPIDLPLLCLSILAPASPTETPEHREEKRNAFLDRAFKHLPSLRYVALAESPPAETLPCKDDYAGFGAPWRWWRVVRDDDGSPVEAREIPGWEGERVRMYLRNADRETAENFDETFVALR